MKLHKLLYTISVLLFLSCSTQAFSMTETYNLDHGKANKHSLRAEAQHKTEVTIVNDTNNIIYYNEYRCTLYDGTEIFVKRFIWSGDGLLLYSDDKEYDSIPVELYYQDQKTILFNDVVPNHTVLYASTYAKK